MGMLDELKQKVLILDIETSAVYDDGTLVDIRTNFENYVARAKCKWFGAYSYRDDKYHLLQTRGNENFILALLEEHDIVVGFNLEEFDYPILVNNSLLPDVERGIDFSTGLPFIDQKYHLKVDTMIVLGKSTFMTHKGLPYKNRGQLMGYNFKKNSLKHMAKVMGLEAQKGDIDYHIFLKDEWSLQEKEEIKGYLQADVMVTKQMFDKLWDFWRPFTEFISRKNVENLSWIRSSIASLTYKAACHTLEVEETFSDKSSDDIREMGGRVLLPLVEEAHDCWIVDVRSLYPHMMVMFGLFKEVEKGTGWNGNDLFKTKGDYDIIEQSIMGKTVGERLKERMRLKEEDKENPMLYALKIYLNALYGITSSEVFDKVYTPNIGWDVCYLGQQVIMLAEKMMDEYGFQTIGSDTDSLMLRPKENRFNDRKYIRECLDKVVKKIKDNVPFPVDTFDFDIENKCPQMIFPFSMQPVQDENGKNIKINNRLVKKRQPKKKNYMYLYEKSDGSVGLKVKGLPIIKDNSTVLGRRILDDILTPLILKKRNILFTKQEMNHILNTVLQKPGALELLQQEYRVKPARTYKNPNQIQAQISTAYFGGDAGVINLIKNNKVGGVGKSQKYATVDEVRAAGLTIDDLDLTKLNNELEPFIRKD